MFRRLLLTPVALLFAALASSTQTTSSCDRSLLVEATNRYIAAQSLGQVKYLTTLSPNATYTENASLANITGGILSHALKIDHSRSIHDVVACSAYTELIIADPSHPYVIGTQLHVTNGSITKVETLVTDADDWLFNAQHTLVYALRESWETIPVDKRDTRQTIQAAADAYLDLFKKGNGSVAVPWADNCRRLEGGLYTAPGDTCNDGVPSGVDLVNRRYVVDETVGVVDVFLTFGNNGLPDSHEFRIENGKIRYVHTLTVCSQPNCGFGDLPAILGEDIGF
ncbi:hypothetical protein B0H66DRAFT_614506 [Apodospora peruviana]|uniref:DUF8021 domain-containing protein n=1 Tax=Apodospora peruviana TaxID=516989 RepID=A0AAE0HS56_9PEZI|nr:hypothetical protein B0H66DRAFT_614506 [Apodospora peruviana]